MEGANVYSSIKPAGQASKGVCLLGEAGDLLCCAYLLRPCSNLVPGHQTLSFSGEIKSGTGSPCAHVFCSFRGNPLLCFSISFCFTYVSKKTSHREKWGQMCTLLCIRNQRCKHNTILSQYPEAVGPGNK